MPPVGRSSEKRVRSGLEVLSGRCARALKGKRVGLLAHPASVTSDLRYAWDVVASLPGVRLSSLFSPEHGLMGAHQDQEGVCGKEPSRFRGVPVYSLYGDRPDSLSPRREMLERLDVFLVDLQDVGSRYYTFIYTLSYCMEACRDGNIEVWVLDRPNPLGGAAVEGNVLESGFESFVGRYPLPVRHGMTIGECARMFNDLFGIGCRLTVVPMSGWRRSMWFDQTGLPWVPPSPNMPTLETAAVYPGGCLLEGTNLSEGRGTTRPFEIVGAPWIDPPTLADALGKLELPGVIFRPLWFRPTFQKYAGQTCGGVQVHVRDRGRFLPFRTGMEILRWARKLWPGAFQWRREPYEFERERLAIDLLAGGSWLRDWVESEKELESYPDLWREEIAEYLRSRAPFLLY
ncbi:MAG: DUF1343 domain-containing protein [bacterium]